MTRTHDQTPASGQIIDQESSLPAQANGSMVPQGPAGSVFAVHPLLPEETPLRYVARMMELLPEPDEDAVSKIAAGILSADNLDDENELWDSTGSNKLLGRTFVFRKLTARPSDREDAPLPFFLVCMATDYETGEDTVITTGSVNICTSLIKAHLLGNLPAAAEIAGPRRKPKSGNIPLHLRWVLKMATPELHV